MTQAGVSKRAVCYIGVVGGLILLSGMLGFLPWRGSTHLHTLMEVAATLIAGMVGVIAVLRFYAKRNNLFLIVGTGFCGTALLDGYHALLTSEWFAQLWPSPPPSLIPWSWNASRVFLSVLLFLSWWAWRRERTRGKPLLVSDKAAYLTIALMTLVCFVTFAIVPLPLAYYPELPLGRPEELLAGTFFVLALIGYLRKGAWRKDNFEHGIVVSLMIGAACQLVFMSRSFALFDVMFDTAHVLKLGSYCAVFAGLLSNIYYVYRDAERSAVAHARVNEALNNEVGHRLHVEEELRQLNATLESQVAERTRDLEQQAEALRQERESAVRSMEEAERARRAATQAEEKFRTILESAPDAMLVVNTAGKVVLANERTQELFGYTPQELLEQPIEILVPPHSRSAHRENVKGYFAAPVHRPMGSGLHLHGVRKDGTQIPVEISLSPFEANDQRLACAAIRDVSERRRVEEKLAQQAKELERSNVELEHFANVAAHDLQEPLRKIQAFGDRLFKESEATLSEKGRDYLHRLQGAAARMRSLINDLLAYSRVTTKAKPFEAVDLNKLTRDVLSDLEVRIEDVGGRIDVGELPTVYGDELQLRQVLQNLIGNALKFHRTAVAPIVGIHSQLIAGELASCKGEMCRVAVQDNGIGFDEKHLDRIFNPFQRLHGRGEFEGTGMGLAICRKIVERHGGTITAASAPGEGSTFFVDLPLNPQKGAKPHEGEQEADYDSNGRRRSRRSSDDAGSPSGESATQQPALC